MVSQFALNVEAYSSSSTNTYSKKVIDALSRIAYISSMIYSKKQISAICDVLPGYPARGKLELANADGVRGLQLRDVSPAGDCDVQRVSAYDLPGNVERYRLVEGDVVFRSRGDWTTAAPITQPIVEPMVAIMPVFIIRPKIAGLDSRYLAWAINQPLSQRTLSEKAQGSGLRMVPKSNLEALEVTVPDYETQLRIVEVASLARRERDLMQTLANQRFSLSVALLSRSARGRIH